MPAALQDPDHDVANEQLPPPPDDRDTDDGDGDDGEGDDGPWVTVATFWHPTEAHLARLKLESEGIDCFLSDENIVTTYWLYANAVGGVKLLVREQDAPRAAELLRRGSAAIAEADAQPLFDGQDRCPRCGCADIHTSRLDRRLTLLSILLLGAPLPIFRKRTHCAACRFEW